jgi:hypothetical protein
MLLVIGGVLVLGASFKPVEPYLYLGLSNLTASDDRQQEWLSAKLAGCGRRAIIPLLDHLRRQDCWSTRVVYSLRTLRQLGPEARAALISRIDAEKDPRERICYISLLQRAFGDFSRVGVWVEDVIRSRNRSQTMLEHELANRFGEAVPSILLKGNVNPEFIKWARSKRLQLASKP